MEMEIRFVSSYEKTFTTTTTMSRGMFNPPFCLVPREEKMEFSGWRSMLVLDIDRLKLPATII